MNSASAASDTQILELAAELKKLPVKIGANEFELRELVGTQRDRYLNLSTARLRFEKGRAVGINNFEGYQTELLALSLYDSNGKAVPETTLAGWPSTTLGTLYKKSRELSNLGQDDKEVEAAKND